MNTRTASKITTLFVWACAMSSNVRSRLSAVLASFAVLFVLSQPAPSRAGKPPPESRDGSGSPDTNLSGQEKVPFPKPSSHGVNWIRYHGKTVDGNMTGAGGRDDACIICHVRNDCMACHTTQAPSDHTNTWRTLSHGFAAGGNRERCASCHRQDYCVRCHDETAPRSHRSNWITGHCTWCHFGPDQRPADSCGVCHRVAAHLSAPHPINASLNCTLCHP